MRTALLVLIAGCASPYAFEEDAEVVATLSEPEVACLRTHCASVATRGDFDACRESSCAVSEAAWAVVPTTIRYEHGAVFAQCNVEYTPQKVGDSEVPRDDEAFLGVTFVREDGEEVDLAVLTVLPTNLDMPFVFSADVGDRVQDVIFGLWDVKVEPCDVDRHGCREFGFVLDGSLASWPPSFYENWKRQRIPKAEVKLVVRDGGGGADKVAKAREAATQRFTDRMKLFGSRVAAEGAEAMQSDGVKVIYAHPSDELSAMDVAEAVGTALGVPCAVEKGELDGIDLEVVVGP